MPRQYSTTGVSLATSTLGKPHLVGTGGASGFGTFDYESEGSTFPAKRMSTVHEALKELHEILMGDVESSESSESDSEEAGGEFEMEMEDEEERKEAGDKFDSGPAAGVGIRSGRRASMMAVEQARPGSVVSTSASTSTSLKEKPSKGWRKGVARESVRFQLMVDVPCWEPGCYSGKSARALCDALPLMVLDRPAQTSRPCKRCETRRSRPYTTSSIRSTFVEFARPTDYTRPPTEAHGDASESLRSCRLVSDPTHRRTITRARPCPTRPSPRRVC